MTYFFQTARILALDMLSTLVFLGLYTLTKNLTLAVGLGIGLSLAQITITHLRGQKIDTLTWVSAILVLTSGTAVLLTHDIRFIIIKLSVIYVAVGATMLKPGWMDRYAPPIAVDLMPDILRLFGFIWAGLMFVSAAVSLAAAYGLGVHFWEVFMPGFAIASKTGLFLVQFATMRIIGRRRYRLAQPPSPAGAGAAASG
jgi:intracellular septation protein A